MKKLLIIFAAILMTSGVQAQAMKFAYVDTEYILSKLPEYKTAKDKLKKVAREWDKEIKDLKAQVEKEYENFQRQQYLMNDDAKKAKQDEIEQMEKEVADLRQKRFGPEGDLFKKEQELVKPIQDKVFNAILKLAEEKKYDFIFDRASGAPYLIFVKPEHNVSDLILQNLGYK